MDRREPKCYECGKLGHIATRCPSRALYGEGIPRSSSDGESKRSGGVFRSGTVDGSPVTDILLDTGCTRTMVHEKLIPRRRKTSGEVVIRCAHGDEVSYPLTEVQITVDGRTFTVEAGVSHTLPVSVLLGTDVPQLVYLLRDTGEQSNKERAGDEALAVVTRTQARKQAEEFALQEQSERASGVEPSALTVDFLSAGEHGPELGPSGGSEEPVENPDMVGAEFDAELFIGGKERVRQTRKQKRTQRKKFAERGHPPEGLSADQLRALQQKDETLAAARKAAEEEQSTANNGFYYKDGILYHQWTPPGRDPETMAVHQLVLPSL